MISMMKNKRNFYLKKYYSSHTTLPNYNKLILKIVKNVIYKSSATKIRLNPIKIIILF